MTPLPLMALVREWAAIKEPATDQFLALVYNECGEQLEAALEAWAEQLEHDATWWSPAQIMERVLGVEE